MLFVIAIAVGGALGALLRVGVSSVSVSLWGSSFPYGTLIANVVGCLAVGIFYSIYQAKLITPEAISPETRAFIQIGVLGALTTFSTFSLETLRLLEQGDVLRAGLNVALSIIVCLLATWIGLVLGRRV